MWARRTSSCAPTWARRTSLRRPPTYLSNPVGKHCPNLPTSSSHRAPTWARPICARRRRTRLSGSAGKRRLLRPQLTRLSPTAVHCHSNGSSTRPCAGVRDTSPDRSGSEAERAVGARVEDGPFRAKQARTLIVATARGRVRERRYAGHCRRNIAVRLTGARRLAGHTERRLIDARV